MRSGSRIRPALLLALLGAAGPLSAREAGASDSLLPAVMGPMERMLWGERGLMRGMGFPLTLESRERELGLRRTLLTAHQAGGWLTLAAMTATVVSGQLLIGGGDPGYRSLKTVSAWTTVGAYSTTALLALLAPPPFLRRAEWNTISWHKGLAVVHATGMFVTPVLGLLIEEDRDARVFHQVAGYTTLAALAGAMLVVTF